MVKVMSVLKVEEKGVWEKRDPSEGVLCTEMGEDFCPHSTQTFLENVGRVNRNVGNREFFHDPQSKGQSSYPTMVLII